MWCCVLCVCSVCAQGLISVGDLSTMLLYSVYAGFSISALLSYYGDLMKVGFVNRNWGTLSAEAEPVSVSQLRYGH